MFFLEKKVHAILSFVYVVLSESIYAVIALEIRLTRAEETFCDLYKLQETREIFL